jgi:1-acyl-sn-glycerol-3-phosphate acyltransferase
MKDVLDQGMHMCIYPEGTRNKTNLPLTSFHDGAFKLAVETGTAIIPALIFNTKKILPPDKPFYFLPAKMELHFLPPVAVSKTEEPGILKIKVFEIMRQYYLENK